MFCTVRHPGLHKNERLGVVGDVAELGSWQTNNAQDMVLSDGVWMTSALPLPDVQEVEYKYIVQTLPEFESILGERPLYIAPDAQDNYRVSDVWGRGIRSLSTIANLSSTGTTQCRFEVTIDREAEKGDQVTVVGDHPLLGAWREEDGLVLTADSESNRWVGVVQVPRGQHLRYKYVVTRSAVSDKHRRLHIGADRNKKVHVRDVIDQPPPTAEPATAGGSKREPHARIPGLRRLHSWSSEMNEAGSQRENSALIFDPALPAATSLCQFDVRLPQDMGEGTRVFLLGSHDFVGDWQVERAVPMYEREGFENAAGVTRSLTFSASMHLPLKTDLDYAYIIKAPPLFEALERTVTAAGSVTIVCDAFNEKGSAQSACRAPMVALGTSTAEFATALANSAVEVPSARAPCRPLVAELTQAPEQPRIRAVSHSASLAHRSGHVDTALCTFCLEGVGQVGNVC